MKTHILFSIHYLELGGAETSLLGLLESLDYSRYDVDLFVHSHRGELLKALPAEVHLLPEMPEYAQIERPLKDVIRDGFFRIALARLRARFEYARYARRKRPEDGSAVFSYVARRVAPLMPELPGEYDVAVSYLAPHDYVLEKVRAKKKLCWLHTDYSSIDLDKTLEKPVFAGYDSIVAVSESVCRSFLKVFPGFEKKMEVRRNLLPFKYINARAAEGGESEAAEMPAREGIVNILSVGRFCRAKNFDNVPRICRILNETLNDKGLRAVWYLIGYGSDEVLIRQRIAGDSLPGEVVILGKKDNPYPYMKACDLYVQPSRFEGDPVTVHEAAALGRPVVLSKFSTSADVAASLDTCATVPLDNEGCARGLADIICSSLR